MGNYATSYENYSHASDRFWTKVLKTPTCWLWQGSANHTGYGRFRVGPGRGGERVVAHRFAWQEENGPIPDGLLVCHHCDTPSCVRPDHLFLGTPADNAHDRDRKGRLRVRRGTAAHSAKLNPDLVRYIRTSDKSTPRLAQELGVAQATVWNARAGITWTHVVL